MFLISILAPSSATKKYWLAMRIISRTCRCGSSVEPIQAETCLGE